MPAPTQPPFRRAQTYRFSRTQSAAPPHARPTEAYTSKISDPHARQPSDPHQNASLDESEKERQRLKAAAAAAAKLAEQEAWEKTRGAGSAVLDLLSLPDAAGGESDDEHSSSSNGNGRQSRSTTPGSASGSNTSAVSMPGSSNSNSQASSSSSSRTQRKVKKLSRTWEAARVLPSLEDVQARRHEPLTVTSADKLLSRGISEYTLLPKILGRGKFSSVFLAFKPHGPTGEPQLFAIKHTPLFPHHPLIATRLLREPTLLAELPPHPNLVNVYETIRTPGHFYLVEEYLDGYVTLEALLPMRSEQSPPHHPILPTGVANCVLDQLLSAVHAIHHPLQICHRDIKPENILVHPDTLQLKLLDFGLATHFSRSEAKLSTCCGSPAFHCPEIVTALRNPLGTVHYWGPEVDAWTCGITMLRLLTGIRYPIGASHTSVRSMSIRAQRAVATIKDAELRDRVGKLLEINGERRMRNFEDLVKALETPTDELQRGPKEFKSTTFIPVEPQHKMNLPLVVGPAADAALTSPLLPSGATPSASKRATPMNSRPSSPTPASPDVSDAHLSPAPSLLLSNPTYQPPQRVLSYIKYCLRCAGILYHCWPDTSSTASLPSTPGPFDAAFQDYNNSQNNNGGTSAAPRPGDTSASAQSEGIVPASLSPSTPFPIQAARSERDPYSHIHVFECVLEIVDPPERPEDEPQSLVQSIFSALSFGRRPANRRSLSTPPKPQNLQPAGMPRPPGTPADAPVSGSGSASGKAGDVKCLTFYLVLRFPRRPSGHVSFVSMRPSYSRASSVARSHRARSRASSAVGAERDIGGLHRDASTDSLTHLSKLHSSHAEFATGIHPLRKAMIDSNHTTPRASRTSSPAHSHGNLKKRDGSSAPHRRDNNDAERSNLGLTIETSPELLRIAEKQSSARNSPSPRSTPNSRSTSRARSRKLSRVCAPSGSYRGSGSNKVFVHVTDMRAVEAVRKALSIGGTTTDYNPDPETDYEDLGGQWASPDFRLREMTLGEESNSGTSGARHSSVNRRGHHSHRQASGLPASVAEDQDNDPFVKEASKASRPTWADVPAGSMKPRSTISDGSDEHEQYTRGRSLGPAGSFVASTPSPAPASGIPVPTGAPRMRASSNLAFAVVHEESSPSNTEQSVSQSKTMVDLHDGGSAGERNTEPADTAADPDASIKADFDLTQAVASLATLTAGLLKEDPVPDMAEVSSSVSSIAEYVLHLQTQDVARFTQELDALSFDLFRAMSPLTGLTEQSLGSPIKAASQARQVLYLLGEHASSREVYMAIDMRCGEMLDDETRCTEIPGEDKIWSSAAEAIFLMHLLNTVLPRIRTKKPQGFSQVFGRLPQCLMLGLASVAGVATQACEKMAEEAVKTCCSTALIVVDWEAHCTRTSEREPVRKASREALSRFLQGVTVCLPYLAGAKLALSEEYFFSQNPRYIMGRGNETSIVKRNEALFAEISKTLASLEVDLGSIWANALVGMSHAPEDDETRETLTALGVAGFVLHVHLLHSGYARDRPSEWKGVKAQTQLEAALPVALLAVSEQTKAAASPELEEGKEEALADTNLLWMQWCLRGVQQNASAGQRVLPVELAVSLAQSLATQSVISPSPAARLIRFKLLTDLLVHKMEKAAALQVIRRLITSSPFAQLRAGGISILCTALGAWLSPMRKGDDADNVPLADSVALLDEITVLPAILQTASDAEGSDPAKVEETLAEESGKIIELVSLLFWLQTQQRAGNMKELSSTTINLGKYEQSFVQPLEKLLERLSTAQVSEATQHEQHHHRQQIELLQIAVQRLTSSST